MKVKNINKIIELIKIVNGFGFDNKTRNTHTRVKFKAKISESYQIKIEIRQGDSLSPLVFNILEKNDKRMEKNY